MEQKKSRVVCVCVVRGGGNLRDRRQPPLQAPLCTVDVPSRSGEKIKHKDENFQMLQKHR